MTQPWIRKSTEPGPDLILFQARFDLRVNPRNGKEVRAVVLEASDWVNVTALTPEGKIVVVKQLRFGTGEQTSELPAGIVEEGEDSKDAAIRELREETGYAAEDWEYLGYVEPNPAFLDNRCHHWLARNAAPKGAPSPDEGENIDVELMTLESVKREIAEGRMRHSLAITALSAVFDLRTAVP